MDANFFDGLQLGVVRFLAPPAGLCTVVLPAAGLRVMALRTARLQAVDLPTRGLRAVPLPTAGLRALNLRPAGLRAVILTPAGLLTVAVPSTPRFRCSNFNGVDAIQRRFTFLGVWFGVRWRVAGEDVDVGVVGTVSTVGKSTS